MGVACGVWRVIRGAGRGEAGLALGLGVARRTFQPSGMEADAGYLSGSVNDVELKFLTLVLDSLLKSSLDCGVVRVDKRSVHELHSQ